MKYNNIREGYFLSRPNRFIANIDINGKVEVCHVKNTGRCRELLVPGAKVFLEEFDTPIRKTKYDLISVYKGDMLVNIDSQVPNKVFYEWVLKGNLFKDISYIKSETVYGKSRFDFYIETLEDKIFLEVKGVTLEQDGIALFPDAPTERGLKHINELIRCMADGYKAYVCFIIQMKGINYFTPSLEHHREFALRLKEAQELGVNIFALDSVVTSDSIIGSNIIDIRF